MQRNQSFMAAALATAFLGTALVAPLNARASEEGKRNTAIGLGAASAALLFSGHTLPGVLAAGGAAYAYGQYQHSIDARHRRHDRRHWHRRYHHH